jgi:hypothetical protein
MLAGYGRHTVQGRSAVGVEHPVVQQCMGWIPQPVGYSTVPGISTGQLSGAHLVSYSVLNVMKHMLVPGVWCSAWNCVVVLSML